MFLDNLQFGSWTLERAQHNYAIMNSVMNSRTPDDRMGLALGYQKAAGYRVDLPYGDIPLLPIVFRRSSALRGEGPGNTRLMFPPNEDAVKFFYNSNDFPYVGAYPSGQGAALDDLTICVDPEREGAAKTGPGIGISSDARVNLRNLHINGFSGNGIDIRANVPTGEASNTQIRDVRVHNCGGWGISVLGGDSNVISVVNASVTASRGGMLLEPQMGGIAMGCHVNNGSYSVPEDRWPAYQAWNDGSAMLFAGCYAEADTPQPTGCADTVFLNCHFGSGVAPGSLAQEISGGSFKTASFFTPFGWAGFGGEEAFFSAAGMRATYGVDRRFGPWAKQDGSGNWLDIGSTNGAEFTNALALPGAQIPGFAPDRIRSRPVLPGSQWMDRLYLGGPNYNNGGSYGRAHTSKRSVPTEGTWQQGDFISNALPNPTGPLLVGWTCVSDGDFSTNEKPTFREIWSA